jgi:hypothetical protein
MSCPIIRAGVVICMAPERELNPRARALDLTNRDTARAVLNPADMTTQG